MYRIEATSLRKSKTTKKQPPVKFVPTPLPAQSTWSQVIPTSSSGFSNSNLIQRAPDAPPSSAGLKPLISRIDQIM